MRQMACPYRKFHRYNVEWPDSELCGRDEFIHPHFLYPLTKPISENLVSIPKPVARSSILGERFHHLLPGPDRGGMGSDVEVDHLPPIVPQYDQPEEIRQE